VHAGPSQLQRHGRDVLLRGDGGRDLHWRRVDLRRGLHIASECTANFSSVHYWDCVVRDAGTPDAGTPDASTADAGTFDAASDGG